MPAPFVFITTHRIKPGQFERFIALSRDFEEFLRVNEPDLLGYYAYLDADRSEVSLVQIHRDANSAEHHMNIAAEKIGQGIALTETVRVEVYGNPGPVVGQAGEANAVSDVQVSVKPEVMGASHGAENHQRLPAIQLSGSNIGASCAPTRSPGVRPPARRLLGRTRS
jgi:hypothetical protein